MRTIATDNQGLLIRRRVKRSTITSSASLAKPMLTQLRPIRHRDGSLPSRRSIERERSAEKWSNMCARVSKGGRMDLFLFIVVSSLVVSGGLLWRVVLNDPYSQDNTYSLADHELAALPEVNRDDRSRGRGK